MTGGGEAAPPQRSIYDLSILRRDFASPKKPLKEQLMIPEPTAVVMLETQRVPVFAQQGASGFRQRAVG